MFFHPVFMLCLLDVLHERLHGRGGCSVPCPSSGVPRAGGGVSQAATDTTQAGWGNHGCLPRARPGASKQ